MKKIFLTILIAISSTPIQAADESNDPMDYDHQRQISSGFLETNILHNVENQQATQMEEERLAFEQKALARSEKQLVRSELREQTVARREQTVARRLLMAEKKAVRREQTVARREQTVARRLQRSERIEKKRLARSEEIEKNPLPFICKVICKVIIRNLTKEFSSLDDQNNEHGIQTVLRQTLNDIDKAAEVTGYYVSDYFELFMGDLATKLTQELCGVPLDSKYNPLEIYKSQRRLAL